MRHFILIISAFVLSTQGLALADESNSSTADSALIDVPPPPLADTTCQLQQLPQCQQALTSCQTDVNAVLDLVQKTCAGYQGVSKEKILEIARNPKIKKTEHRKTGSGTGVKPVSKPIALGEITIRFKRSLKLEGCPAGGLQLSTIVENTVITTSFVCDGAPGPQGPKGDSVVGPQGKDGKDGSSGRPGQDGSTRMAFALGMRTSAIWSSGRPIGTSVAPEASLELWITPTVEFVAGVAWAPNGDRNMVVTSQLRYRGLGKRIGFGFGLQYQAWNLVGNKALWQSVLGMGSVQLVLLETAHVDINLEAGLLVGLDGYDAKAQFAIGGTGQVSAALKF